MSYIPQKFWQWLSPEPSLRAQTRNDSSRFWAVLIGIDAYPVHPLYGCVSDACAMEDYLINNLEVPEDHIRRLLCPHNDTSPNASGALVPTRANIVNTLLDLSNDARIQLGDNIIIYFSGHGASYECQNHKDDSHQICLCGIEAMCPSDRNTMDASNNPITDITDREFNTILTQICRAKGRKITVILDCCFSASLARAPGMPARILEGVRSLPPSRLQQAALGDALRTADNTFKGLGLPEYRCILDEEWRPNMESHVVLAACSEHEFAREFSNMT
ncbi:caspase domain-containing protein [Armillaria luteobubalina]|uniref:Caspase domain-containing protein n=1 Tax=Armillaria luteobubalina TaxID=153913 RepID=A0AA39UP26_9AGAR|nr:caspase domain-containing protein [Armillaria luteobubalina]